MVPGDCLFCVRINNLDAALGQVDLFLNGVFPIPGGVSMPVKAQLGQLLGSADAKGLNTAGSFTVFGPLPGGDDPDPSRIGILIPVSDYKQFVSGNQNVGEPDASGISKISPDGDDLLAMTQMGSYALATRIGAEQGLAQAKKLLSGSTTGLAGSLDAAELKRAGSAPVWVYGNLQLAGKMFGPVLQAQLASLKGALQQAQGEGQVAMAPAAAAMDMYTTMLDTLTKEARYASVALEPSADKIGLGLAVAAAPGTNMADMLKGAATKPENKLRGYLQNGAAVYFSGSMNAPFWQKINEAYISMLPGMMGNKLSTADAEKLKKMMTDISAAFDGPVAGALSVNPQNKPPFEMKYVAALKDSAKFYQMLDEVSKMMNEGPIAEFYKSMGMNITFDLKRKTDTYKDVAIDTIKMKIAPTDADSPEAQMITAMYGGELSIQLAATNNLLIYTLAQDPATMMRQLIDQVKSGAGQVPSEMQSAMQMIPGADKADFFMTYSIIRLMQIASVFAPIPQVNMPSQSAVAVAGNVGDGKMTLDLAVPKQQVMEVMQLVMQMQMQQMQQDNGDDEG
jgi:hypothetical protein